MLRYGAAIVVVGSVAGVIYKQTQQLQELEKISQETKVLQQKIAEYRADLATIKSSYSQTLGAWRNRAEKMRDIAPNIYREAMSNRITDFHDSMIKFGLPSEENLHFYSSFISSANYEKRIPNWVFQHITADDMSDDNVHANRTHSQFTGAVPHIPEEFQASNKDYFHSGWSRGHMVPAGDNRKSQEAMDDTFHLNNNIVPQNLHNNMHFWYRLEVFAKNTMTRQFDDVYVISGPAFIPTTNPDEPKKKFVKYEVIGDNDVAVPTHIYKVILVKDKTKKKEKEETNDKTKPTTHLLGAFLVPNEKIPENKVLTDFEVPLEYLEKHTGLKFFRNLDRQKEIKPLCAHTACQVMTEAQLTQWNYARQIDWSKTRAEVDKAWEEYQAKGYTLDDRIKRAYERKIAELNKNQKQE